MKITLKRKDNTKYYITEGYFYQWCGNPLLETENNIFKCYYSKSAEKMQIFF